MSSETSYTPYEIEFDFELYNKTKEGQSKITIGNSKCAIELSAVVGSSGNMANIKIFGLSTEIISTLTSNNINQFQSGENGFNIVSVKLNKNLVFKGGIYRAYCDPNLSPNHYLELSASGTVSQQMINTNPYTFKGSVDVVQALSTIGNNVGVKVVNFGVKKTLANPHYTGDAIQQMVDICEDLDINFYLDWGKITIWDTNSSYPTIEIDKEHGLIGYPAFQENGIRLTTQYTDLIKMGGLFKLTTLFENATGEYIVSSINHFLSQNLPGDGNKTIIMGVKK